MDYYVEMKGFISVDGEYYESVGRINTTDEEVPTRPSHLYDWDPDLSKWMPNLTRQKQAKEINIREEGERRLLALSSPYCACEKETWFKQEREARAWLLDNTTSTPMLSAIATGRGIPIEDIVSKVMENVNLFETISGSILGQQQALLDALQDATTEEEISSIQWA